ncbi:TetR family transcriptional regulator [Microbacterium sp. LWH7-1.2]|uniref:TetR/AcrR family transcriptional regulator n=1 Tax=Microbacterium sp. LWH7-1.2 TaxID=3135257 RepID=UPI00313A1A37
MPKVSKEYREARRDEIARAALRALERNGVRDTSIADIVAESGLSTGAIYSHFTNKAELARYVVGRYLLPRIDALEGAGRGGEIVTPRDALRGMLSMFEDVGLSPSLILQFWGEAMVEPGVHDEMLRTAAHLRASLALAVGPWARAQSSDEKTAEILATETARSIAALAQGYIANSAVFGPRPVEDYLESAAAVLAS